MTIKSIIILMCVSFLITFLINKAFIYNKTSYLLMFSIFIFNSITVLFFILELEFIAITFSMIYVGGIAVMFLFLIMVVDVNVENAEGSIIRTRTLVPCFFIAFSSVFITFILMNNFDVHLFNSLEFVEISGDLIAANFSVDVGDYYFFQHHLLAINSVDL